ncbi:ATP-binding protein [Asticcacaulis sp. 201]|uniref:ATP-binding protein n=1 Tax=Asticcacaulis sp. 201 TaxID=3028787 RepID=UPI002916C909|nr:ATP-binding protein [Asticcacaulis sp. 201]MDV6330774.1 ATP-binding protein [Asticcacaulis sp. 201]
MKGGFAFKSMGVQVFALLAIGMSVAAILAFFLADYDRRDSARREYEERVADRVLDVIARLDRSSADQMAGIPSLEGNGPGSVDQWPIDERVTKRVRARLASDAPTVTVYAAPDVCTPAPVPPRRTGEKTPAMGLPAAPPRPLGPGCRVAALQYHAGPPVLVPVPTPPVPPNDRRAFDPLILPLIVLAALGLAYWVSRKATYPIRRMAEAAAGLGVNIDRAPLIIEGPTEVQQAAKAFNLMQMRLKTQTEERTLMLAAITHDLQTPLTRQRLRLEKVQDSVLREELLQDYFAMQELIRDGLELARIGAATEALQPLDIGSLLESLCQDARDAGQPVTLGPVVDGTVATHPAALKRCLSNLIDNALKYGGSAEVSALAQGDVIYIQVTDNGPGIPEADRETAMRPFVRLDRSVDSGTEGAGLGLTIARMLAERSGAVLVLDNAEIGGLVASVAVKLWK